MKVTDIMSFDPRRCTAQQTVVDAACMMRDEDVGEIPVVDEHDQLVGVITDRDITVRCVAANEQPNSLTVGQCMTAPALWLREDRSVEDAAHLMANQRIRRVPVVDAQNRLCGIVSLADLEQTQARSLKSDVTRSVSTPHY